ncbi:MAG: MFS transporter [Anaerolineae bacterium]|nr:MFS transporter [Anaerolineae bacterium]
MDEAKRSPLGTSTANGQPPYGEAGRAGADGPPPIVPQPASLARVAGAVRLPKTFTALHHRNFRLYWVGQVVSLCGTWMQTTAQNWLVYQLTASPFTLGLLNFANQTPTLLFTLFAGVMADRANKRTFLITTQTLAMLQAAILAVLVYTGTARAEHVIVLAFILGTINAFDNPIRQSFTPELVPKTDIMNAVALGATAFNGARIIGPAIGGAVVAWVGASGAFGLNALSFLAVLAGLFMIQYQPRAPQRQRDPLWTSLREGVNYIRGNRAVITLLLQASMVGIFGMPYATLMPVMAADVLGLDAGGYGLLMSATGVGALAGALILASLGNYRHKGRLVMMGDFLFPTLLLLFTLSRVTWLSTILLAGMGLFLILRNATTNTLLQTAVPDQLRGRVISVYMVMFIGMTPVGALQSGWLAQNYGAPFALQVGCVILLLSALLVLWRRPEVRNLP